MKRKKDVNEKGNDTLGKQNLVHPEPVSFPFSQIDEHSSKKIHHKIFSTIIKYFTIKLFGWGTVWWIFIWLYITACLIAYMGSVGESDLFLHITMGNDIRATGNFTGDPSWTFWPVQPTWINTLIVPEIIMSYMYEMFGWASFAIFRLAAVGLFMFLLWKNFGSVSKDQTDDNAKMASISSVRISVILMLLVSFGVLPLLSVRPQTVGFLFSTFVGVWAVRLIHNNSDKIIWWHVGLITWVWANFHGSAIVVAPVLAGAFIIGLWSDSNRFAYFKHNIWIVLAAAIAPLLTLNGINIWVSALTLSETVSGLITEWYSTLESPYFLTIWCIFILLWGVLLFVGRQRSHVETNWSQYIIRDSLLILGLTIITLPAVRTAFVLYPTLAVIVAARASISLQYSQPKNWEILQKTYSSKYLLIPLMTFAVFIGLVAYASFNTRLESPHLPLNIWAKVSETPGKHKVLTDLNLASQPYFFLKGSQSAIDGRMDRYGKQELLDVNSLLYSDNNIVWNILYNKYPEPTDVVMRKDSPAVKFYEDKGWKVIMKDNNYILLQKS